MKGTSSLQDEVSLWNTRGPTHRKHPHLECHALCASLLPALPQGDHNLVQQPIWPLLIWKHFQFQQYLGVKDSQCTRDKWQSLRTFSISKWTCHWQRIWSAQDAFEKTGVKWAPETVHFILGFAKILESKEKGDPNKHLGLRSVEASISKVAIWIGNAQKMPTCDKCVCETVELSPPLWVLYMNWLWHKPVTEEHHDARRSTM